MLILIIMHKCTRRLRIEMCESIMSKMIKIINVVSLPGCFEGSRANDKVS